MRVAGSATLFFSQTRSRVTHDDNQPFPARPGGRCLPPACRADVECRRQPAFTRPADVSGAQALVKAGKFKEALTVLRPLAGAARSRRTCSSSSVLAATGASQQPDLADDEREALLDEAIASLHTMLIDRPGLVRVRLELARAFFLKGEDSLARGHFERVLAGKPVAPVVANVQRFLAEIRARRRWTMYLGAAVSPDSNIGGASDEQIIYINDLPFRRDAEELTTSGIGVSVWTGGEYQHPLGDRLRLRLGGDLSRQDYGGRKFDQTFVSAHIGPRWLVDRDTEVSLVGNARRRWTGTAPSNDDLGARVEAGHRLTPRIRINGRASWYHRDYLTRDFLDGPILDFTLGGSWVILPILRADGAAGYARERPKSERWRNASRWLRLGARLPCRWASPWAAAVSCAGRTMRVTGSPSRATARRARTGRVSCAQRSTTAPSPCSASARNW